MGLLAATIRVLTGSRALDVAVVDASGNQVTAFNGSSTPPANATLTTVVVSTTSTVLAASNANRRRLIIHNDSAGTLFVAFAATATTTAFSVELGSQNTYDGQLNDYTGVVSAIRAAGSSNVRITEVIV